MLVFRELKEDLLDSSSLALGFFDGVHTGHQKVIRNAVNKAKELNLTSVVVTFLRHPKIVLSKTSPGMISSLDERLKLFENSGVNTVLLLDFNEELAKMTAKQYMEQILIKCLNPKNITIGYNHRFGGDQMGNSHFLREYGEKYGFEVDVVSPVRIGSHVVSSSAIRKFILNGDVASAEKFLGRTFTIKGEVIHGQHLGRKLGFPTANLNLPEELIIPANGVYKGLAEIESKLYYAVINVGKRPTVDNLEKDLVEVHVLEFNKDIYGQNIQVSFLQKIREEKKFDSLEDLKSQIKQDCDFVREKQVNIK